MRNRQNPLIRYFIDEIARQDNAQYTLMASTGRAAKILTNMSRRKAQTIHSVIYVFNDFNQDLEEVIRNEDEVGVDKTGQLYLTYLLTPVKEKNDKQRYYIVDEASMISDTIDENAVQAQFGSGRTLSDLMKYDPDGKFVFVGDECQLPPIGQDLSPALSVEYFRNVLNVHAVECTLTDIVRQQLDNSIILGSTTHSPVMHRTTAGEMGKTSPGQLPTHPSASRYCFDDQRLYQSHPKSQLRSRYAHFVVECQMQQPQQTHPFGTPLPKYAAGGRPADGDSKQSHFGINERRHGNGGTGEKSALSTCSAFISACRSQRIGIGAKVFAIRHRRHSLWQCP
jgi:hypothetical protein